MIKGGFPTCSDANAVRSALIKRKFFGGDPENVHELDAPVGVEILPSCGSTEGTSGSKRVSLGRDVGEASLEIECPRRRLVARVVCTEPIETRGTRELRADRPVLRLLRSVEYRHRFRDRVPAGSPVVALGFAHPTLSLVDNAMSVRKIDLLPGRRARLRSLHDAPSAPGRVELSNRYRANPRWPGDASVPVSSTCRYSAATSQPGRLMEETLPTFDEVVELIRSAKPPIACQVVELRDSVTLRSARVLFDGLQTWFIDDDGKIELRGSDGSALFDAAGELERVALGKGKMVHSNGWVKTPIEGRRMDLDRASGRVVGREDVGDRRAILVEFLGLKAGEETTFQFHVDLATGIVLRMSRSDLGQVLRVAGLRVGTAEESSDS